MRKVRQIVPSEKKIHIKNVEIVRFPVQGVPEADAEKDDYVILTPVETLPKK